MDIVKVMKDGVVVLKNNPVILVPPTIVSLIMSLLVMLLVESGMITLPTGDGWKAPFSVPMMNGTLALTVLGMMFGLFVHGMTVGMARDALDNGSTSLGKGLEIAMDRFYHLTVALISVMALVFAGSLIFVVPGVIAAFLLMFTFVVIIVDNSGPLSGMKRSFDIVKSRLLEALLFFVVMLLTGIAFGIADIILSMMPVIGPALDILLSGALAGYVSVVMVLAYRRMTSPVVLQ